MTAGVLSLLAPEAADLERLEACVQLVRSLAAGHVDGGADLDLRRAEVEYEVEVRATALELCSELFHLHLASLTRGPEAPRGSGLEAWQAPRGSARGAWLALLELEGRGLDLALPSLPEPGEPAALVAARILSAAECLGAGATQLALWRAHLVAADEGPRAGGRAYRGVLELGEMSFVDRETAHLGYLGCLLMRGAVVAARDWTEAHMDIAAASPRLMRMAGWVQLAAGDEAAAEEYLTPQPRANLPAPVVALGDRLPALRSLLAGCAEWDARESARATRWTGLRRGDLGAAVLCLVRLDAEGVEVGHAELAPAIGNPSTAWLDRQAVALFEVGEPEHELQQTQCVVVEFPNPEGTPVERRLSRGCLSPRCRGLALVPLFGAEGGALAGWLRLEFEHRLVPELARLERFARAVGRRLGLGAARPLPSRPVCALAPGLLREAMLGFSMGRRRWWGVALEGERLEFLCSEGAALDDWVASSGGRGLVRACLEAGRPMVHGADEQDFVHRAARSGIAMPLGAAGLPPRFALVVESTRAADLGLADVEGLIAGRRGDLRGLGARLEAAAFARSHREEYGQELSFCATLPTEVPAGKELAGRELPLPGTDAPDGLVGVLGRLGPGVVLIEGPAGSGKRTLARLRAFLGGDELVERQARGLKSRGLAELLDAGAGLIRDLEELSTDLQVQLFEAIEAGHSKGLVATLRSPLAKVGLWERLADALVARRLALPGLEQRRAELPGLFESGLRRAARAQGTLPPALTEEARALVWRQTWPRGLHDVMDLTRRLVPLAHGRELDASELTELAAGLDWKFEAKLASRRPEISALWQALDGTRKKSGAFHRGRAAGLLGWDPDTLTARLRQLARS